MEDAYKTIRCNKISGSFSNQVYGNQRLINAQLQSNKNMQNAIREETTRANETSKVTTQNTDMMLKRKGKIVTTVLRNKKRGKKVKEKTNNLKKLAESIS